MICKVKLHENGEMILNSNMQDVVTHSLKCKDANSGYMSPGALFMGSLAGCKILTFMKAAKFYKVEFSDLEVEVEADVRVTENIDDTPFKYQEYDEIRTLYSLKTKSDISEIEKVISLASKFCTVNIAIDDKIKQTFSIEIL